MRALARCILFSRFWSSVDAEIDKLTFSSKPVSKKINTEYEGNKIINGILNQIDKFGNDLLKLVLLEYVDDNELE